MDPTVLKRYVKKRHHHSRSRKAGLGGAIVQRSVMMYGRRSISRKVNKIDYRWLVHKASTLGANRVDFDLMGGGIEFTERYRSGFHGGSAEAEATEAVRTSGGLVGYLEMRWASSFHCFRVLELGC